MSEIKLTETVSGSYPCKAVAGRNNAFFALLAGLLLAIALEGILCVYEVSRGLGSVQTDISTDNIELTNCTQETDGTISSVDGGTLIFHSLENAGTLELVFAEPLPAETSTELYWSTENQEADRFRYEERYLLAGTKNAVLKLPFGNWEKYRLDIHGAFHLAQAMTLGSVPLSSITPVSVLREVKPLRFLLFTGFFILAFRRLFSPGSVGEKHEGKQRQAWLDAVRVFATLLVIAVHVIEPLGLLFSFGSLSYLCIEAATTASLSCNLLFILISGALLLPWRNETFLGFLHKRMTRVVVPFLVYALIYIKGLCITVPSGTEGVQTWLFAAIRALMAGSIRKGPHLWLIYVLLGLYLIVVPFRYMLKNMPEKVEKELAAAILFFFGVRTVFTGFGMQSGITVFLGDWPGIFLMGYFLTRDWMRRYDGCILAGVAAAFLGSVYLATRRPDFLAIVANRSIFMLFISAAVFTVFLRLNGLLIRLQDLLAVCSRRSYSVLLVHYFVLYAIVYRGIFSSAMPKIAWVIAPISLCAFFSFLLSLAVDFLVTDSLTQITERLLSAAAKVTHKPEQTEQE